MRILLGAIAALLVGCQASEVARTQIMLVVDSDLSVPSELDEIEMRIAGPSGDERVAVARLADAPLPRSLALVHTEGPLAPLNVRVTAMVAGNRVLERRSSLAFVEGRTLVLPMHLVRSCLDRMCGEQTCTEDGCRDAALDPATLGAWSGQEPTLGGPKPGPGGEDAGMSEGDAGAGELDGGVADDSSAPEAGGERDGGPLDGSARDGAADARVEAGAADGGPRDGASCQPQPEQCNERDDDCNGVVDNGFDIMSDPQNCGRCGNICGGSSRACCRGMCMRSCF